jgi:Tfp pilus assembly protein PilO
MASKLDELNKLEPKKKAGVLGGAMLFVYVVFSFVIIGDMEDQAQAKGTEAKKIQKDIIEEKKKLDAPKKVVNPENDPKILKPRLKNYKAQMPTEEEFGELIKTLKQLADKKGLDIRRIQRLDAQKDDYVSFTPISIVAEASFPVLVKFLTEISREGSRIITLHELTIRSQGLKDYMPKGIFTQTVGAGANKMTDDQKKQALIRQLDAYEYAARKARLEVEFTLHAYTYTGKPLSEDERKKRKKRRKH